MSLFGAVWLYLAGRDAAASGHASSVGEEFTEGEVPYDPPAGAWRRWWTVGAGATRAARVRRRARRVVPQVLQPKIRPRS